MKYLKTVNLIILVLLSLAAGAAKVMQVPDEVAFFQQAGVSLTLMLLLGTVQVGAGILICITRTRVVGLVLAGTGFLASTAVILMVGKLGFALVSLLPVLLAALAFRQAKNGRAALQPG